LDRIGWLDLIILEWLCQGLYNSYAKKPLDIYNQLMYYLFSIIGRNKRLLIIHEMSSRVWGKYVRSLMQELTHNIRENKIFMLRTKCKEK